MRLFGGLLLLCCAALPASSDTWNLGGRKSLLVVQPPSGGGAKAVPVMTVTPNLARSPQPVTVPFGTWFSTHIVVVLFFMALVAYCTVYGADCMLFMFNRDGYERLIAEREEFLEETRRRQRELLESEGTPLLPVHEYGNGSKTPVPRNKHSAGRGGR